MAKSETIWVTQGKHGPCFLPQPIQGKDRVGAEPMEIPNDRFARRRLAVGDLVEVPAPAAAKKTKDKE